jgi:RNA polymerase sigma-70 factor (ECF subfamily)
MAQLAVHRRPEPSFCLKAPSPEPAVGTNSDGPATLEQLYRRERPKLLVWLTRRVGAEQARDLAQEVFVRAAMSDQLMQLQNPCGFLFRIARNLLIDEGRRQQCRIKPLPLFDGCDAAHNGGQEDHLNAKETTELFERAMSQLPEKTARIFAMSRFEKKTYREIHKELGISLATVDYHMMKALAYLRDKLIDCR